MSTISPVIVRNLHVNYGSFVAVNDISFEVEAGVALGVLGGNGAGKSSTLRVISSVNPPTGGQVLISGMDVTDPIKVDNARMVTGYCPDVGGLIKTATIREHIGITLTVHNKIHLWNQALELVDRFALTEFLDKPASGFSHGMSRRLSVILAALAAEKVLILDEPFDGVDPTGVNVTIDIINEAKEAGLSVVISTHLQELLVRATDKIIVMSHGTIVASGSSETFSGPAGVKRYEALLQGTPEEEILVEEVDTVSVEETIEVTEDPKPLIVMVDESQELLNNKDSQRKANPQTVSMIESIMAAGREAAQSIETNEKTSRRSKMKSFFKEVKAATHKIGPPQ